MGSVQSDETPGTDVVVRSPYCDLGNVGRIVELWRMNKSEFLIPFILIHPSEAVKKDSQSQFMVKGRLTNYYE